MNNEEMKIKESVFGATLTAIVKFYIEGLLHTINFFITLFQYTNWIEYVWWNADTKQIECGNRTTNFYSDKMLHSFDLCIFLCLFLFFISIKENNRTPCTSISKIIEWNLHFLLQFQCNVLANMWERKNYEELIRINVIPYNLYSIKWADSIVCSVKIDSMCMTYANGSCEFVSVQLHLYPYVSENIHHSIANISKSIYIFHSKAKCIDPISLNTSDFLSKWIDCLAKWNGIAVQCRC